MTRISLVLALGLLFAACGDKAPEQTEAAQEQSAEAEKTPKKEPQFVKGPYGGWLYPLGAKEGFFEISPDHMAGAVTIVTYDNEMVERSHDEPPVLNFKGEKGPVQLIGEGEDAEWLFFDDTLKGQFAQLRFKFVIGGQVYTPVWDHVHPPKPAEDE